MANLVSFDKQKLIEGLDILYNAVAPSLGPRAYTAALDEGFRRRVIDDGVEIAKRVILEDRVQNFGANTVAEAARKTADEAGDSTTATIILAHAIIHESLKLIATGVHPMSLRKGLEEGVKLLVDEVDRIKTPIKGLEQAEQIATISCKDPVLGKLVARTIDEMGDDGIVTVEESSASETYVDYQKGMRFESGYASKGFVTVPETMESIYLNPKILIMDKCPTYQSLTPLFEAVKKKLLPLVIIAPEIDNELKAFLIANKANPQSPFHSLCINAPYAANFQKDFLQDLAILTGATYIPLTEGGRVENISYEDLGECEKIISSHNSTLIVNGSGNKHAIETRIKSIRALLASTPSDFENDKLKERLAKLTTGVAIIKIGGSTEVEMQERKERTLDAVAATKAAIEDGIVVGGERAYFAIKDGLISTQYIFSKDTKLPEADISKIKPGASIMVEGDVKETVRSIRVIDPKAFEILKKALEAPFRQLLTNSGLDVGRYMERLGNDAKKGVDTTTGEVVDMIESGIIDPSKVVKCALKNAVSVAIQFLTINVIIAPAEKEIKK